MVDFRMLNGHKKATAIVRFDHTAMIVVKGKKKEFKNLEELKEFKEARRIETNIEHVFPMEIRPERTREWGGFACEKEMIGEGAIKSAVKILFANLKFIFKSHGQKEAHNVDNDERSPRKDS